MNTTTADRHVDENLWRAVQNGDAGAFEQVVERYQSMVSGVAYNACGDLALSEDVAQETFWAAWRQSESLTNPGMLKAWLRGIARNLGANALRRSMRFRPSTPAAPLDDLAAHDPGPADAAMNREEEAILWTTLEQIPPTYREPLILYYRQDQSVAEVAACLELTEDAVKQRLARGRAMLRDRVAERVEAGLRRSRPGRSFTTGVMAGLSLGAAGAKSAAAAGSVATAGAAARGALASGLAGGLLGSLIGLGGGWLGAWIPAQMAPTVRERDLLHRTAKRMFLASLAFLAATLVLIRTTPGTSAYLAGWGVVMLAFQGYVAIEVIRASRAVRAIRASAPLESDLNSTAVRRGATSLAARFRGRVYRSPIRLLGRPLLDVQVADPGPGLEPGVSHSLKTARGWVAVGDEARGVLLAVGSRAYGLVAIGGLAIGGFSIGGGAVGLVAIGGLGLGLVGIGGLAVGAIAFGGAAVGWQACGGMAVAWDLAIGGGAVARNTAAGALAVASGTVARDARALDQTTARIFHWTLEHPDLTRLGFMAFALCLPLLTLPAMYRLNRGRWSAVVPPLLATALVVGGFLVLKAEKPASPEKPDASSRFRLDNGLTVLTRPIAGAKQTAMLVLYNIGGDHDPEGKSGLAHLIEHIYVTAAAGATPARSAVEFFKSRPDGANAQTGDRYTVFATVFPVERLDDELREAAARMAGPDVKAADLDRERRRVLDESADMFDHVPILAAFNNARETIRPTPRGGRRGGVPAQVRALTLDDVRNRLKLLYKPRNAILVAAGAVDPARFRAAATNHFGRIPGGDPSPAPGEPGAATVIGDRRIEPIHPLPGMTAAACLAASPPQPGSPLYAPYLVLGARLMKASYKSESGPSAVKLHMALLDDPNVAAVSTSAQPGETPEQTEARLAAFLDQTLQPGLGPNEVAEVEQMFGLFLGTVEPPDQALALNPYGVAFALGRREQLGLDRGAVRESFRKVTADSLRQAAAGTFSPSRRAAVYFGPR